MVTEASLRVLAIPAGHRYVQRIRPLDHRFLPDPTDPWWPHPGLEPDYVRAHRQDIDLVHLHFGFEHRSTEQIAAWLHELDQLGLPLVFTVHDLRNPHLTDNDRHDRHLALLVEHATVLLTLTACAAEEIRRRWHRPATVIAHPPLYDAPVTRIAPSRTVGVTFKDRASTFGTDLLDPIVDAAAAAGGQVRAHVESPSGGGAAVPQARRPGSVVTVSPFVPVSDDDFVADLAELDVSVLPYRYGTHSGWLEACRDLGVRVVAPSSGCYRGQWSEILTFDPSAGQVHASVERAVRRSLELGPIAAPSSREQDRRLRSVRADHTAAYRAAMDRGPW